MRRCLFRDHLNRVIVFGVVIIESAAGVPPRWCFRYAGMDVTVIGPNRPLKELSRGRPFYSAWAATSDGVTLFRPIRPLAA